MHSIVANGTIIVLARQSLLVARGGLGSGRLFPCSLSEGLTDMSMSKGVRGQWSVVENVLEFTREESSRKPSGRKVSGRVHILLVPVGFVYRNLEHFHEDKQLFEVEK